MYKMKGSGFRLNINSVLLTHYNHIYSFSLNVLNVSCQKKGARHSIARIQAKQMESRVSRLLVCNAIDNNRSLF